jgi:hypothetical protein
MIERTERQWQVFNSIEPNSVPQESGTTDALLQTQRRCVWRGYPHTSIERRIQMLIIARLTRGFPREASLPKLTHVLNSVTRPWLAASLAGVLLLLSGAGLAQTVVRSGASVPFDFWAQGQKFPAGDYLFDSELPSSISIRAKGAKLSVGIPRILYGDPVSKDDAKLLFVRRDGKYYLTEVWCVQGKLVVTGEFQHRGEKNSEQREVRLVYP